MDLRIRLANKVKNQLKIRLLSNYQFEPHKTKKNREALYN